MRRYFTRYVRPGRKHPYLLASGKDISATAVRVFNGREPLLVKALAGVARHANPDPKQPAHAGGDALARATLNAAYLAVHGPSGRNVGAVTAVYVECITDKRPAVVLIRGRRWGDEIRVFAAGREARPVVYLSKKAGSFTKR